MAKRFRVKAKMLTDADVQWVSLVERPANRIPFRITKMDEDGQPIAQSEDRMIKLTDLFSRKSEKPDVTGVAVRKEVASHYVKVMKDAGLDDGVQSTSDTTFTITYTDAPEEQTFVRLSEDVFVGVPRNERIEQTAKAFMPMAESEQYTDNLKAGTFIPGVAMATDVLLETYGNILRSGEGVDEVRSKMQRAIREYAKHVLAMTEELPGMVFKLEALQPPESNAGQKEPEMTETTVDKAEAEVVETPEVEAADVVEEAVEKAETEEVQPETEEASSAEPVEKSMTPEEIAEAPVEEIATPDESENESAPVVLDIAAVLKESLEPVVESISTIKEALKGLSEGQEKLEKRLDSVEDTARKADDAVSGTVRSNADYVTDRAFGMKRPVRAVKSEESVWEGSALDVFDKISG